VPSVYDTWSIDLTSRKKDKCLNRTEKIAKCLTLGYKLLKFEKKDKCLNGINSKCPTLVSVFLCFNFLFSVLGTWNLSRSDTCLFFQISIVCNQVSDTWHGFFLSCLDTCLFFWMSNRSTKCHRHLARNFSVLFRHLAFFLGVHLYHRVFKTLVCFLGFHSTFF